ncbi:MAG: hypothetical protein Q8R30_00395 [bacterium]|nr:hypothetical protein [bacterium]
MEENPPLSGGTFSPADPTQNPPALPTPAPFPTIPDPAIPLPVIPTPDTPISVPTPVTLPIPAPIIPAIPPPAPIPPVPPAPPTPPVRAPAPPLIGAYRMRESVPIPTKVPAKQPAEPPQKPIEPIERMSAIRTMRSDVERLFKTAPPTVAQMIGKPGPGTATLKKHARIASAYLVLGIFVILAIGGGAGVYYFRAALFPAPQVTEIPKAITPNPYFATETSRTVEIRLTDRQQFINVMNDSMKEFERDGVMKRILIKFSDSPSLRYISLSEFLDFYHIISPPNFLKRLGSDLMIFVYTQSGGTRLGLAARTTDTSRTMRDLLDWEPGMINDLRPLFFGQQLSPLTTVFEDRSYRNIDWRFLKLSQETDIGIAYTVFPAGNIMIIATSKEEMETIINRLFDQH